MARIKPTPHIVENRSQAEGTLAEIAALDRKIAAVGLEMQEAIHTAKAKAGQAAEPLSARRKELADGLAVFARLNKAELFPKGSKSVDLGFGVIGFRASTKIVQRTGITSDLTLEKLHQYDYAEGIRTKEEINRDGMTGWSDEKLETVGLRRQQSDGFYIEIDEEKVPDGKELADEKGL